PCLLRRGNFCHRIQEIIIRADVRARSNTPLLPIPMLNERAGRIGVSVGTTVDSYSPDVIGRDGYYTRKLIEGCARVRTGNNTPLGTIPVFNQCEVTTIGSSSSVIAHGPDVAGRDG